MYVLRSLALVLLVSSGAVSVAKAQTGRKLTMREAVTSAGLRAETLPSLKPVKGAGMFSYVNPRNDKELIIRGIEKGTTTVNLAAFNAGLKASNLDTVKAWPSFVFYGADQAYFNIGLTYYKGSFSAGGNGRWSQLYKLPKEAKNIDVHPISLNVVFTAYNNLYFATPTTAYLPITRDVDSAIKNGSGDVHRNEFGISKGTFWSDDGKRIAFYKMNESAVKKYPTLHTTVVPATAELIRYPMAGGPSHTVKVYVYDVDAVKYDPTDTEGQHGFFFLGTDGDPEHYLTNITWSSDGQLIYVQELNRAQNAMVLNAYSAFGGAKVAEIFRESSDDYVEPLHPLTFLPKASKQFIYQSSKSGFNGLYLYDVSTPAKAGGYVGRLLNDPTHEVTELIGFSATGEVIYQAAVNQGLERRIFAATTVGKRKIRELTTQPGVHSAQILEGGRFLLDTYSSATSPRVIQTIDIASGKRKEELVNAPNPLKDIAVGKTRVFTLKAADGKTPLNCRVIYPPDFDSINTSKRYPTVTYVYGGPHAQMITENWLEGANLWMHLLAQKGYIVFTLDNRGSEGRGDAFEKATHLKLGDVEMADQLVGRRWLAMRNYVDTNRMGIHGWSFGGFMTTSLMTRTPWAYDVGVAGGPVIDWKKYEVMYTERYMSTPDENPEGYGKSELSQYVKNLKGKLMLIHGTVDETVVWQHSIDYIKASVEAGIQVDYAIYPDHAHNVQGPDRVHLMQKITDYFDLYLKP